jgi:hypothetical protein
LFWLILAPLALPNLRNLFVILQFLFLILLELPNFYMLVYVLQFLFETGFGSSRSGPRSGIIGVTQPRRVAVLATAKRVAYELGLHLGKEVGFQVRFDKKIGESSSIKFMTDGILLRELQVCRFTFNACHDLNNYALVINFDYNLPVQCRTSIYIYIGRYNC